MKKYGVADYGITTGSGLGVNFRSKHSDYYELWADIFASWALNSYYNTKVDGSIFKKFADDVMTREATSIAFSWVYAQNYNAPWALR